MKIAILFGANSFEHEISIVSAIALKKVLKEELVYIFCDYHRSFYLVPADKITSKRFSSGEYKKDKKLSIKNGGFYHKTLVSEKKLEFDVLLNVIHGSDGEDGKIASLLDFFHISYIGPRNEASVISYNKLFTKMYANEFGVKTLNYEILQKNEPREINLIFPVIIKPLRLGSSIGISIVKDKDELDYALDVAFEFDNQVLIEPFVNKIKEYNLAGYKGGKYNFSIIEEPQKEEFLDFDKKYLDFSRTKKVNEAKLSDDMANKIREAFIKLYEPLFAGALIRCDFFVLDNEVYINEINPVPGSMANYLFSDFSSAIKDLAISLPKNIKIPKTYKYIHKIQSAKGK
ncbi:MAG: D-alanine--D-alanine ligase [Epsilonproteobacteria bacterium]|nr:D-alanine--D-alanine ligase [Campylobacterota bacterium]